VPKLGDICHITFDMKSHEPPDTRRFVAFCIKINLPVLRARGGGNDVARLSKVEKEDLGFWINAKGEIEYHKRCARCSQECKQSFRCLEVLCPKYQRR